MNKGVLWGGGLGLLVLAFLGGFWLAGSAPGAAVDAPAVPQASASAALPAAAAGAAPVGAALDPNPSAPRSVDPAASAAGVSQAPWANGATQGAAPATARPPKSREERRQVRAQIRALSAELQAKGPQVTMQDVRTYLDKVEKLGEGDFDGRYFKTMRLIVDQTSRAQELNQELAKVAQSTAAADVARKQAILAEMRNISGRISNSASALQGYANEVAAGGKPR